VPVTASSHDSLLQASRRLDRRFLLADPELGRVACLGSHDPELDEAVLTPLFVACWARYTARLARRIAGGPAGLSERAAAWMRGNRYHALWRHTIAHADEVAWRRR
jgi:hypothetical protein